MADSRRRCGSDVLTHYPVLFREHSTGRQASQSYTDRADAERVRRAADKAAPLHDLRQRPDVFVIRR